MRISDWSSDVCSSDLARRIHRLASASSLGLWKWYNVPCTSFTVRNGRSTLPLARATVCRSSAFGVRWGRTRPPRLPITDWNPRDRLTRPLSLYIVTGRLLAVRPGQDVGEKRLTIKL